MTIDQYIAERIEFWEAQRKNRMVTDVGRVSAMWILEELKLIQDQIKRSEG